MLKASVIGNLGNDPETRYSASGTPLLRFNVASNYRTRTPEGEWQDKTEWVRVTVTGSRAESLARYLRKGSRVYVDGRLEARPWADREHQPRAGLEVMADSVEFMGPRPDEQPGTDEAARPMREDGAVAAGRDARSGPADDDEMDLPF